MRTGKAFGLVAIVVLSVAAGTILGILVDRSVLQKKPAFVDATATNQPAAVSVASSITAAEVPERIQGLAKLGHTPEGVRQAQEFAQNLSVSAFSTAIGHVGALNASLRQWVVPRIFERWGREDPAAALAAIPKLPVPDQAVSQNAVFEGWSTRDPKALIAWAESSTNANVRQGALNYGVKELANRNPKEALEVALKVPAPQRTTLWPSVFRLWISRAPEEALKELTRLPPDRDLQQFYVAGVLQWMQQDAPAALAWLKIQPDDSNRRQAIKQIAHLMGATDQATGYSLLQTLTGADRQSGVGALAGAWVRQDSRAALAWARALTDVPDKEAAMSRILEQIGDVDPKAGADLIAQDPFSRYARQSARSFAVRYAKAAPDAALEWAQQLPAGETRDEVVDGVLRTIAEQSPAKAAASATNLLAGFKRENTLREALRFWVPVDPSAAAAFTANLPVGRERNEMLSSVVRPWTEQNPQAAMEWVLTLESGAARRDADKLVAEALARADPPAAARFLDKLPESESKSALLVTVLDFWMPKAFDAAAAWVDGLRDEQLKHRGYERLAHYLNPSDPARAAQYAEKSGDDQRNYVRSSVAARWAETDPRAAAAWAMRLGTNGRRSTLPMVISVWSKKAPADAAAFVEKIPIDQRRNIAHGLIVGWVERDPRAGAKWVVEQAPEEMRESLTRSFAMEWARRDANATVAWARQLPPGRLRDLAASALAGSLADDTAKLAAEMAEMISDPSQRNTALENVARQWLRHSPAEARAWLATNSLPAPRKERLLKNP
jgi:hypothetical protein